MSRIVLLVAAVLVLIWLLRGALSGRSRGERSDRPGRPASPTPELVACAHCGVHLPKDEAFAGPDTELLLARGAELLRALELLALEMLRMQGNEHEKVMFDCRGFRAMRLEELRMAARVAAEKVRTTGSPYHFAPMSSRERRIVHLALRDEQDLRTESEGEGMRRVLVVYPKDFKVAAPRPMSRRR